MDDSCLLGFRPLASTKVPRMEFSAEVVVAYPLGAVFEAYRERIVEVVPHLPNIRSIVVKSRTEGVLGDAPTVAFVNEWHGGGDIPKVVRSVVSEDRLAWTDRAVWNLNESTVDYEIEVHAFPGAVTCKGHNTFFSAGTGTRVRLAGELTVDATKVPGVPKFVAGTLNGTAEKFIIGSIRENLIAVAKAVERLLAS